MLTVYIDFKSLPSYLALKPTLEMASRHRIAIDWRPFLTWERDVPKETHDVALSQRHHEVRLASQRATDEMYATLQGLELSESKVVADTDLALGALALLGGDKTVFVQAAFNAYWQLHADLDDEQVVADLLNATGVDQTFSMASARTALIAAQDSAQENAVVDAPCFAIASQVFVGRQHVPWIEECIVAELEKTR